MTAIVPVRARAARGVGLGLSTAAYAAIWAILSLAAANRWFGLGRDYLEYLGYYETIPALFSTADTRFEIGFHAVAWFFSVFLGLSYSSFALVMIGAGLGMKMYVMQQRLSHKWLALFAYFCIVYPLHEYTQIRASFALGLAVLAIHYLFDGRWLRAVVLAGVAVLFHSSIAILIAVFAVCYYLRLYVIVAIGGGIAAVLFLAPAQISDFIINTFSAYNPLVQSYIENLTLDEQTSFLSAANLLYLGLLATGVFAGWYDDRYRRTFFLLSAASTLSLLLFSSSPTVAQRIKEVLFWAVIFAACRAPFKRRDTFVVAALIVNAVAALALSLQNQIIEF